jgi:hypothetical protein
MVDNVIPFPSASRVDRGTTGIARRWLDCCAALFGLGAAALSGDSELSVLDTPIAPLLWPPY